MTGLPTRLLGSIPDNGNRLLSFPKRPEVMSEPPGFCSVGTSFFSPPFKAAWDWRWPHLRLLLRLRMRGAALAVFPYTITAWSIIKEEIKFSLSCIHLEFLGYRNKWLEYAERMGRIRRSTGSLKLNCTTEKARTWNFPDICQILYSLC